MWNFEQPYFEGKLIGAHEAWNRLDSWRAAGLEIGAWYVAKSGAVRALGRLAKARGGRIDLDGESVHARFDLRSARFAYHPTGIHPRWPMGPTVEVMACIPRQRRMADVGRGT